ncbi:uncharacterized protein LOC133188755 [Saccostrea echinata]|uniref:uncharacterized protein LOC133188755 n=1 Tax=Saccostrea echinata TaxID=191078 RepID=UPI002A83C0EB|nr:uncharacterized protein LOC133188755 [Saccostrea echinata]
MKRKYKLRNCQALTSFVDKTKHKVNKYEVKGRTENSFRDPKCRYNVHLPEASWHTAYDVCSSSNRTLATITSLNEMYLIDLVLEEVDNFLQEYPRFSMQMTRLVRWDDFHRLHLSTEVGLFLFNAFDYPVSKAKPLSSWCPEVTKEVIQEKIANIQKNLTVNRKETSQYIRTLTSAPDERRSSKNIGVAGAFVIGAVGGLFILSDCINIMKGIQNSRVRASNQ